MRIAIPTESQSEPGAASEGETQPHQPLVQKVHLEELFEALPEGIVLLDQRGTVLRANREFLSMFGFEASEVIGRQIDDVVAPDWLRSEADELTQTLRTREAFSLESIRRRKDGTLIDVNILAKPLAVEPGPEGRLVIYRDTSAQRKAERFREAQFATTRIVAEGSSIEQAAKSLLETLAITLGWDYGRFWSTTSKLTCEATWSTAAAPEISKIAPEGDTLALVKCVIDAGGPQWFTEIRTANVWPHKIVSSCGIESAFAFPVHTASGIQYVFEFLSRTTFTPDAELLALTSDLALQIGQFIERTKAEAAVSESEAKFRAVAETAASAIYVLVDDRFVYVNRATQHITGYTSEELLALPCAFDIVHADDRGRLLDRARERESGIALSPNHEFRVVDRNGSVRWIDYTASRIQFLGRNATLVTAFDITERKRAEDMRSALYAISTLAAAPGHLTKLYEGIHKIVGELMYAHNFFIALLDEPTNMIHFPYFVDEFEPDAPPPAERSRGLTEYVLRTGETLFADPATFEKLVASGEVEEIGAPSIDWIGVPLKSGEKTFGVLAVQSYSEHIRYGVVERDILTFVSHQIARAIELKRREEALLHSEARYRSQVQSALYGLYRSTVDGHFLDVNPALVKMLGYDSAEELLALDLAHDLYIKPEERQRIIADIGEAKTVSGVEAHWRRKDGREIVVRLSGSAGIRYNGEPQTFEMIAEDVTERRQLEEQLRHSQKMEAVGRLAGGVAHDFNNVLTVIKGYTDLMLDDLPPGSRLRMEVEEVRRAADRAAELTKQLLAFSRKQVMEARIISVNDVIKDMNRLLRRLLGDDIELCVSLANDLDAIKADPGQIEQVIMNMAVNARDAMPAGGRFTIKTRPVEFDEQEAAAKNLRSAGRHVKITITDTGCGMESDTMSHIFEPFFTTKDIGKGTGLGLSTAYGIVKQSGGHINVVSLLKNGTTFEIFLPAATGAQEQTAATNAPTKSSQGRETILVVEDEDVIRALMTQVLEKHGYKVIAARNGSDAIIAEQSCGKIDLLLTDVMLGKISGREVANVFEEKRKDIRVLFVSGYADDSLLDEVTNHGAIAFLRKPFAPATLVRKVREVLDMRSTKTAGTGAS